MNITSEKEFLDYLKEHNLVILKHEEYLRMSQALSNWHPSEGQLECLQYAIDKAEKDYTPLANNRIYLTLKTLKEELEKL